MEDLKLIGIGVGTKQLTNFSIILLGNLGDTIKAELNKPNNKF